jgi:hypothetical protein
MGCLARNALVPFNWFAIGLAVTVNARNLNDSDWGQGDVSISLRRLWPVSRLLRSWRSKRLEAISPPPSAREGPRNLAFSHTDGVSEYELPKGPLSLGRPFLAWPFFLDHVVRPA